MFSWLRRKKEDEPDPKDVAMDRPVGEGPIGVWIEYRDGERFENLPTLYAGRDADGIDMFDVLFPRDPDEFPPRAMGVDRFPPLTAISIPVPPGAAPPQIEWDEVDDPS